MKITKLVTAPNGEIVGDLQPSENKNSEYSNDNFSIEEPPVSKALFSSVKSSADPALEAIEKFLGSNKNTISVLSGGDNWVYLVNNTWVFRVPKNKSALLANQNENMLLRILQGKLGVTIPKQEYWDEEQGINAYRLIEGKPLSCQCYRKMNDHQKMQLTTSLARFLSGLHAIKPEDKINVPKVEDKIQHKIDFLSEAIIEQKIFSHEEEKYVLSSIVLTKKILASSDANNILLHGDFHGDNLLINKNDNSLSGVIDFSDAKLGPLVFDFCHLYRIDFNLAEKVINDYAQINNLDIVELKTNARALAVVYLSAMILANKHRIDMQGIRRQVVAGRAMAQLINIRFA